MFRLVKTQFVLLMVLVLALSLVAVGCNNNPQGSQATNGPLAGQNKQPSSNPTDSQEPQNQPAKEKVTLYFSDEQALFLVAEEREISKSADKQQLVKSLVEELVKGPTKKGLGLTVPQGVKVNEVKLENGLVTVDLSKELQTNHWGGSTGETMTIYSLVNTLTEIPEVTQVQILVDGNKIDSIAGHLDIKQPLIRDNTIIKK